MVYVISSLQIVRKFREGGYNTLVATCVGEEGLDIGEVDLIVCFDAPKSPIRLVQRLGRTGRRRSGRIVVIVSEGKEDNVYNKSQSSKRSIHKAIREGCKKLDFFLQRCRRMVPRHIDPRPHKMHMTRDAFIPTCTGKRKNGNVSEKGKQKAKRAFLDDQELACWSEELSLSDREFRAVEKSVEKCFGRKMPFLSSKKLKNVPQQSSQSTFDSSFVQPSDNTSINTSVLNSKLSLSLSKWIHFQTAPVQTKVGGHSSTTSLLRSCLDFSDLLKVSEGMGASYDLEMQTFLNREDVGEGSDEDQGRAGRGMHKDVGERRKGKKPARVFVDSSDDEDFVVSAKEPSTVKGKPRETAGSIEVESVGESRSPSYEGLNEDEVRCVSDDPLPTRLRTSRRNVVFTASQHMVPSAPTGDSLDWLDDLASQPQPSTQHDTADAPECEEVRPLTQHDIADAPECEEVRLQTQHDPADAPECVDVHKGADAVRCKNIDRASKPSRDGGLNFKSTGDVQDTEQDFIFVTPKPPPKGNKMANHPSCSTPKNRTKLDQNFRTPPLDAPRGEKSYAESVDLFDDFSPQDLFDNFSVCLQGGSTSKSIREDSKRIPSRTDSKLRSDLNSSVRDSETPPIDIGNVTVICESDLEEEEGNNDGEVEFLSPKWATGVVDHSSPECSKEESYVLHRQRKRRKVNYLESPQEDGRGNRESGGSNISTPVARIKSRNSRKKQVTINVDSSDDEDFQAPLMKRLRDSRKSNKCYMTRGSSSSKNSATKSSCDPVNACDYIEEEAELSGEECSQLYNDEEIQDIYDTDDSFINDNSMLTQYTQAQPYPQKVRSSGHGMDMYKQSLISPKDKIFGKRKGRPNEGRFRMVLSQRHQILNHYMGKAGFHGETAEETERGWHRKRRACQASSSGSEAEEVAVAYGEEDEEMSQSPVEPTTPDQMEAEDLLLLLAEEEGSTCEQEGGNTEHTVTTGSCPGSSSVEEGHTRQEEAKGAGTRGQKQRAQFLSESEEEPIHTSPVIKAAFEIHKSHGLNPKALQMLAPDTRPISTTFEQRPCGQGIRMPAGPRSHDLKPQDAHSSERGSCESDVQSCDSTLRYIDSSKLKDVLISPSLLTGSECRGDPLLDTNNKETEIAMDGHRVKDHTQRAAATLRKRGHRTRWGTSHNKPSQFQDFEDNIFEEAIMLSEDYH
jgi:hypothetical protein